MMTSFAKTFTTGTFLFLSFYLYDFAILHVVQASQNPQPRATHTYLYDVLIILKGLFGSNQLIFAYVIMK